MISVGGTPLLSREWESIASLLLAVLRGMESLHNSAVEDGIVIDAGEQALRLLRVEGE